MPGAEGEAPTAFFARTSAEEANDAAAEAAVLAQVADLEREARGLQPPLRLILPTALPLPRESIPEPDHIQDPVGRLLWALSARVTGRSEPNLTRLPGVASRVSRGGPGALALAPMPHHQLGEFEASEGGRTRVLLSRRLERLRAQGAPADVLAAVLAHELDHAHAHFDAAGRGRSSAPRTQEESLGLEEAAFGTEGDYLEVVGETRLHRLLEDAATRGADELAELYADAALILEARRSGRLAGLIRAAYARPH